MEKRSKKKNRKKIEGEKIFKLDLPLSFPMHSSYLEPLVDLGLPVLDQAGRTNDDRPPNRGLTFLHPLLQQSPEHRDALERLPQSHVVGEDTSVSVKIAHAHD